MASAAATAARRGAAAAAAAATTATSTARAVRDTCKVDIAVRLALKVLVPHRFYERGWGPASTIAQLNRMRQLSFNQRESFFKTLPTDIPIEITDVKRDRSMTQITGHFPSPLSLVAPGMLPKESETAHFQLILPPKVDIHGSKAGVPMCLQLAGTGDHYFWKRRMLMGKPLAQQGVASILLENPFYGLRKPPDQFGSSLLHVTDLFVLGAALVMESAVLLKWCEREGYSPLAINGISMGGFMASLLASIWPKPIALVSCMSGLTCSGVFLEGALSQCVDFDKLIEDLPNIEHLVKDILPADTRHMSDRARASLILYRLLDIFTNMSYFPKPVATEASVLVTAQRDGYIPMRDSEALKEFWEGCTHREVEDGHILSYFRHQGVFRDAIMDALERARRMEPPEYIFRSQVPSQNIMTRWPPGFAPRAQE